MLQIKYYRSSKGTLERKVRAKMEQIGMLWDMSSDFERVFKVAIQEILPVNHVAPEFAFRLRRNSPKQVDVWHFTPDGTMNYKIATITEL